MAKTLVLNKPVVAITGSAGKSTTKEMTAAILQTRWRVFKSVGNLNFINHTRNYASNITSNHRAAVLEYGLSGPGHIRMHCLAIQPNISVITNIGTAHIGSFGGDVSKLAYAKSEMIRHMKLTGTAVLNYDDKNTKLIRKGKFRGKIVTFGMKPGADYRATSVQYAQGGMQFSVLLNGKTERFFIPVYGGHHVYNALAAIAVSHHLGFRPEEMRRGLRHFMKLKSRLTVIRKAGVCVIDDSYSANPNATIASLDVLSRIGKGTNMAVLGSMLGMGNYTARAHGDVGRHVAKSKVHRLYTFGQFAKRIGEAAVQAGFDRKRVHHFVNRDAMHKHMKLFLKPGSTWLVKGSHAVGMRHTVAFLQQQLSKRAPAKSAKIKVQ